MHILERTIRRIARREKRLLLGQAACVVMSLVMLAIVVAGLLDYSLRIHEAGLRWLLSGGVVIVAVAAVWRYLLPVERFQRSDVSTALRIERCFPALADRLSSAVAFLQAAPEDAHAGSLALRHSLVDRVTHEIARYPLQACLSSRAAWRAMALVSLILVVTAGLVAANPPAAQRAGLRLAMPWNELAWPRRNHLEFVETPMHLGPGQDFEATVVDQHGELPESVEIQYWFAGDAASDIQTRPMRFAGGRMTHRLSNVHRPFRYRAVGGDDDKMPWIELNLVEPPQLERLTVHVEPPAYSGRPAQEASGPIEALVGSTLQLRGRADQPLTRVALQTTPAGVLSYLPMEVSNELSDTFQEFTLAGPPGQPVTLQASGSYRITMSDQQGRRFTTQRWELRAVADEVPTVRLATISSTGMLTADAAVPVEVTAHDDLRVTNIELRYTDPAGQQQSLPLWKLDQSAAAKSSAASTPGATLPERGDEQRVSAVWDLGPLKLPDGSVLEVHATAQDSKQQTGSSTIQRLRIIGSDELQDRLVQAQASLVSRLAEVLSVQRDVQQQTTALQRQLSETGQVAQPQVDQLQSAELAQRRVGQTIADGDDSLLSHINKLLQQLEVNRIAAPELRERLAQLAAGLTTIDQQLLPVIQRDLLSASKLIPRPLAAPQDAPPETVQRLDAAAAGQQQVIEQLETITAQLGQWEDYQRLVREIEQIGSQQGQIASETAALQPETLGREWLDLPAPLRSQLERMAQRQSELARRFEHLLSRMEAKQRAMAASDPQTAQELADALQQARSAGIAASMRASSGGLQRNQLAESLRSQHEALDALSSVADALLHRRVSDPAILQQQLADAQRQVEQLHDQQQELQGAQQQLAQEADPQARAARGQQLADQQRALSQQTGRLQRRATRLGSQAASPLDDATRQMESAADSLPEAAEAQQHAQAAQDALRQAAEQLATEVGRAAQQQFRAQIDQLRGRVQQLAQQQRELLQATLVLSETLREQGQLSGAQQAVLQQLGARQRQLADEVDVVRAAQSQSQAFVLQLDQTQRAMLAAAERLVTGQPDAATQQPQQEALRRLEQILAALEPPGPDQAPPPAQSGGAAENPSAADQQQPANQRTAEELKLVLLAQQHLLERTQQLETARQQQGQLTAAQQQEEIRIAEEQAQLAELVSQWLEAP